MQQAKHANIHSSSCREHVQSESGKLVARRLARFLGVSSMYRNGEAFDGITCLVFEVHLEGRDTDCVSFPSTERAKHAPLPS